MMLVSHGPLLICADAPHNYICIFLLTVLEQQFLAFLAIFWLTLTLPDESMLGKYLIFLLVTLVSDTACLVVWGPRIAMDVFCLRVWRSLPASAKL